MEQSEVEKAAKRWATTTGLTETRTLTSEATRETSFLAGAAWQREQYEHELSSATYNWERQPGAACQPCESNWTIRGELMKLLQCYRKEHDDKS